MVDTSQRTVSSGYTIIELTIVIIVVAIMAAYIAVYVPNAQVRSRDTERKSDTASISRYFEQRYLENASSSYATYPSTTSLTTDTASLRGGGLKDALYAPRSASESLSAAATTNDLSSTTTISTYIYQPFKSDGSLCSSSTAAQPCVRFKLWYRLEENSPSATTTESRHQQ